jgi:hypothetical protein
MFDHTCTACEKHRLVFASQVTSVTNTDQGIAVDYTCWCGAEQTWLTGSRRATRVATPTAA